MLENPAIVAVTAVELIVLASATGAVASDLWILPSNETGDPAQTLITLRFRLRRLLALCVAAFALASAAELVLRTASMSELPVREAFSEIDTVLFKTHYGQLWWWRVAALSVLGTTLLIPRRDGTPRLLSAISFFALTSIMLSLSASGHAGDDGILSLANIADALHILGAFLWGGGIIATTLIILPSLIRTQNPSRELIAMASLRLSTLSGIALALTIIPGIYNAWLQIGGWQGLWSTLYGQLLVAKLLLVAGMIVLGALNRYRYIPAIQRHAGLGEPRTLFVLPRFLRTGEDAASVMHFFRSLRAEALLLTGVLILAATLSQQMPAAHAEHDAMPAHMHSDI